MTQVAASVFPGGEATLLWLGAAILTLSVLTLLAFYALPRSGASTPRTVPAELRTIPPASISTDLQRLSDLTPMPDGEEITLAKNVTPAFFMQMLKSRTGVQSEGVVAPYIGKRMTVSGTVTDVSKVLGSMTVSITPIDCGGHGRLHDLRARP